MSLCNSIPASPHRRKPLTAAEQSAAEVPVWPGCRQRHAAAGRVPVAAIDACTGSSHCEKPWVGYMPTEKR